MTTFDPDGIERTAEISQCGTFRWALTRRWRGGMGRVCWIMLNPSTADGRQDDPTIRRCIHFTRAWGYDELRVVNLYPFRSSSPAECRRWADWESGGPDWHTRDAIHFCNLPRLVQTAKNSDLVVAAWGENAWDYGFIDHVIEEIQFGDAPWPAIWCLGLTAGGAPKHPMARGRHRVPDDQMPMLWKAGQA